MAQNSTEITPRSGSVLDGTQHTYLVMLFVEHGCCTNGDLVFAEFVQSNDDADVIEKVRSLVGERNPSVNIAKATGWPVGRFRNLEAAKTSYRLDSQNIASI